MARPAADRQRPRRQDAPRTPAGIGPGRLLAWGLSVAGLAIVGTLGWALHQYTADPQRQPIRTIRVTGELRYLDRGRIEQIVAEAIDGGFYTADMERIRSEVRRMPWVDQVSIRRVWPDTLVMDVREQVPFARWGEQALVNPRGEVFRPAGGGLPGALAGLYGPAGSAPEVVDFYRRVRPGLQAVGLRIAELGLNDRREWSLRTAQGTRIHLGRRGVARRLRRLLATAAGLKAEPGRHPERIDLRYEHGYAVRWRPAAQSDDRLAALAGGGEQ